MESALICAGFRRAIVSTYNPAKRRLILQPRRLYATPNYDQSQEPIRAASPIRFTDDADQFAQPHAEIIENPRRSRNSSNRTFQNTDAPLNEEPPTHLLRRIRIIPASRSYFTGTPAFTDDLLHLTSLIQKYTLLPTLEQSQAPKVAWKRLPQYRRELGEPVREMRFEMLIKLLDRLNRIHPALLPVEVQRTLSGFKRTVQPHLNQTKPIIIDDLGRARAVGRRKSSHAVVFLVEGEGECLINGRSLTEYFGRLHDRESALWALKATQRLDKYNVWAVAKGGGTTGQAEAITLGVGRALAAHEPGLLRVLRKAGVMTRDPRRVERKKPGKLKARKMPAWVKR